MTQVLPSLWIAAATTCLVLAGIYFAVWIQRPVARAPLFFSLAALGASGCAATELAMHQATRLETYMLWLKLQHLPLCLLFVALVWLVHAHLGAGRRWLAFSICSAWLLFVPINLLLPHTLIFQEAPTLRQVALPWGEVFTLATGPLQPWKLVMDAVTVAFLAYVADASWTAWRRGARRPAAVVGGSIVMGIGLAGLMTPLVDAGILHLPYLVSASFVVVVFAMAFELTHDVVRAATLTDEVRERERRWQAFLDGMPLLVVEVEPSGIVASINSFFAEVTGVDRDHVVGRPFTDFVPTDAQERYRDAFRDALRRGDPPLGDGLLVGAHDVRTISWSTVLLRDAAGRATGVLGVGADLTDLRHAEKARDDALTATQTALAEVHELKARLEEEVIYLKDEIRATSRFSEIVGNSAALSYVLRRIEQVAPLSTTVLIEGETGVGKELVARAIHRRSPRASRPMIRVNCAVLPPTLVEAELFGHEKGAFTGADRLHRGRFELADRGTLFLDEISELPADLQAKLLRVLEGGEFERVGGDRTIKVDVRVLAATNRQLQVEVQEGRFREDLFYRLHVFPITVPPLRRRTEDIPALVYAFVERFAREQGKVIERVAPAVLDELRSYAWPGNVRELENVIERAVIGTTGDTLRLADRLLPSDEVTRPGVLGYRGTLHDVDREYVREVLELSGWRIEGQGGAAERLGLHPNTLRFRMRKLGVRRPLQTTSPAEGAAADRPRRRVGRSAPIREGARAGQQPHSSPRPPDS